MTYHEIEAKLKEPFPIEEIEFRIGSTNQEKTMGLALAYVQARAIQNRLDQVLGIHHWKVAYQEVKEGFLCSLSLFIDGEWITKEDGASVTEFESVKGGISNAFKRVASSGFGIGRYLYDCKNRWYPIKQQGRSYVFIDTPSLELKTEQGESRKTSFLRLDFGKYKGKTLEEVFAQDIRYIQYLLDKSKNPEIIKKCQELLKKERIA